MRKMALVLTVTLLMLVAVTPAMAGKAVLNLGTYAEVNYNGRISYYYINSPVYYDNDTPGLHIRGFGGEQGREMGLHHRAQVLNGGWLPLGGGYYYPQQPVYQPQPQYYQPTPQPYYQPMPQPQYYPQQPPAVVYQPVPHSNPYAGYIEGVFVGAIGNIIESAGVGAGDRVYDEIARGGRRYRGYYRGGHYRR